MSGAFERFSDERLKGTDGRVGVAARRRSSRRGAWFSTVLVGAAIATALAGVGPLLQGVGWWFGVMLMVTVLLAVAGVLRAVGAPELVAVGAAAIVWAVGVLLLYAGDTLWLVFPTTGTLGDLIGDLGAAGTSIAVQEVPAVADAPITQLMVMAVGLIAIIADALATGLRAPVLSAAGPLAVLAVSPIVRRNDPDVVIYVITAALLLLLVWYVPHIGRVRDVGRARPDPAGMLARGRNGLLAAGLGAASIAAMLVVPQVTPGLTARDLVDDGDGGLFASVYSTGVDPSIQLGRDLRRSDPVLSLSYSTTAEAGLYLRMVTLGDFSAGTWEPERPYDGAGYEGDEFSTPPGLSPDVPTTSADTSVTIAALRSDWLPLPYPTRRVSGLEGNWLLTPSTLTMTDLSGDTRGLEYGVSGLVVQPTADQLAQAGASVPDSVQRYLGLPPDLDPVIGGTAATVAQGAATNYDRAVALQEYFRSDQFEYSLQSPVEGGFDGDNAQAIVAFLEAKSGYCVHYAATMAVMARTLGIPSRIAVGYAPGGSPDATSAGRAVYEVFTDQLHSWPELYFEGIGWLPFEPTPGLDFTPPDYSLPDYAQAGTGGAASAPAPSSTSSAAADRADADQGAAGGAQSPEQLALAQLRGWGTFAAILGGVALIVLAPWGVRASGRRRRLARLATDPMPATVAWSELEDTLDDFRFDRASGDTVLDLERRLNDELSLPADVLERARRAVEREQYAPPSVGDTDARSGIARDLGALLAAVDGGATTSERVRARLLPASLWRRLREWRGGGGRGDGDSGGRPGGRRRPAPAAGSLVP
jgi:transglutaminase-like putative cysteine protease